MLKEYSVSDILDLPSQHIPYYVGRFEDTDVEWTHRHDFYSLVWFTAGTRFYIIDMEEYEILLLITSPLFLRFIVALYCVALQSCNNFTYL